MERPELYMDSNAHSTLSVARACLKANVPVLYFSSAAVYGEPVKLPIPENHPLKPLSPYGLSKLFSEEILKLYSRRFYGTLYIVFRMNSVI